MFTNLVNPQVIVIQWSSPVEYPLLVNPQVIVTQRSPPVESPLLVNPQVIVTQRSSPDAHYNGIDFSLLSNNPLK